MEWRNSFPRSVGAGLLVFLLASCREAPLEGRWRMQESEAVRYDATGQELAVNRDQSRQRMIEITPTKLRLYDAGQLRDEQAYRRVGRELQLLRGPEVSQRLTIKQLSDGELRWEYTFAGHDGRREVVTEYLIRDTR